MSAELCAVPYWDTWAIGYTSQGTAPSQASVPERWSKIKSCPLHSPEVSFLSTVLVNWSIQKCSTDWQFFHVYVHSDCVHCSPNSVHSVFLEGLLLLYSVCQKLIFPFYMFLKKEICFFFIILSTGMVAENQKEMWSLISFYKFF